MTIFFKKGEVVRDGERGGGGGGGRGRGGESLRAVFVLMGGLSLLDVMCLCFRSPGLRVVCVLCGEDGVDVACAAGVPFFLFLLVTCLSGRRTVRQRGKKTKSKWAAGKAVNRVECSEQRKPVCSIGSFFF